VPLNLSFTHLAVVGIVALVVLGPERLPGVARTAGNLWREWQRIRGGLEAEVREVISDFKEPFMEAVGDVSSTVKGTVDDVRAGITAPPLTEIPPLPGAGIAPGAVAAAAGLGSAGAPLSAAMPALAPSTGLVSPGPVLHAELPELAPPPDPDTFVPFDPVVAAGG
jgi:Sec-independent protein translocase protein TatA